MKKPLNVRRSDVMPRVQEAMQCFRSPLIDSMRANGNRLELPGLHISLASSFGFCDGVSRAIEIAYAACLAYPERRIWLIGEIIHNPEVNAKLDALGLRRLPWNPHDAAYELVQEQDLVIIPAFGITRELRDTLEAKGVDYADTTCGNVIKVWSKVQSYARRGITSIIHGKARHEESLATASRSRGDDGCGKYLIIYNKADAEFVADFLNGRVSTTDFNNRFAGCTSPGFDPEQDLMSIGMANQTTMLKGETVEIQGILRRAVIERDGREERFHACNTICSATQDRQDALFALLEEQPDAMFIIGGYNSSNTTHLAGIAAERVPTFFVRDAESLLSLHQVRCLNLRTRTEELTPLPPQATDLSRPWRIGITAGASCPANVIEQVIRRLADLRTGTADSVLPE